MIGDHQNKPSNLGFLRGEEEILADQERDDKLAPEQYCNGPLPLNGQLVTDIVSAATAMHCDWVEAFHRQRTQKNAFLKG
jgi:hypothetical protein